jgi:lysophospholipase L1-like esterase
MIRALRDTIGASIVVLGCMTIGARGAEDTWRFDFSSSQPARGFRVVSAGSLYDAQTGFGFEPPPAPHLDPAQPAPAPADTAPGPLPVVFSVAVPEGDYRVTVKLGDRHAGSETTVMAESRRLMLQNVTTKAGQFVTRSFIVNVRNAHLTPPPPNAPGGSEVRIKDREKASYTWDDKLTLEFYGANAKVVSVEIEPVRVPRLFLLGDSTVTDQMMAPGASWGQMLPRFFVPDIAVANYAESGETMKSFLTGLRLDKVLSEVRPGDWVFIQFGHNDEKQQWPQTYVAADTTYRSYLKVYIAEIKRLGANPVLISSMQRRTFDAQGHVVNSHGAYPDAVRAVAAEEGVPFIDLSAMSTTLYEALGPARAPVAFGHGGQEITHHNNYGAYELARCVVRAIQDQALPLADHLAPDAGHFDPANPDPPESLGL